NPANYTIFDPGSADFNTQPPKAPAGFLQSGSPSAGPGNTTITFAFTKPLEFKDGDWVNIVVQNVWGLPESSGQSPAQLDGNFAMIARQVAGTGPVARITRDVE